MQIAGQLHGQGKGGAVFVVLDGDDGLPGDAQGSGQVLLAVPLCPAELLKSCFSCADAHQQNSGGHGRRDAGGDAEQGDELYQRPRLTGVLIVLHSPAGHNLLGQRLDQGRRRQQEAGEEIQKLYQ